MKIFLALSNGVLHNYAVEALKWLNSARPTLTSRNTVNQFKRFSFSLCLMFVALSSTAFAQGVGDPIGVKGAPASDIIYRSGSSWGEHPTNRHTAEDLALIRAETAFLLAAVEIMKAGHTIIKVEPPETDHVTLYEYPFRFGSHASWSITAKKGGGEDSWPEDSWPDDGMIEEIDLPDFIDALAEPE